MFSLDIAELFDIDVTRVSMSINHAGDDKFAPNIKNNITRKELGIFPCSYENKFTVFNNQNLCPRLLWTTRKYLCVFDNQVSVNKTGVEHRVAHGFRAFLAARREPKQYNNHVGVDDLSKHHLLPSE